MNKRRCGILYSSDEYNIKEMTVEEIEIKISDLQSEYDDIAEQIGDLEGELDNRNNTWH